jgi:hypothetical protein
LVTTDFRKGWARDFGKGQNRQHAEGRLKHLLATKEVAELWFASLPSSPRGGHHGAVKTEVAGRLCRFNLHFFLEQGWRHRTAAMRLAQLDSGCSLQERPEMQGSVIPSRIYFFRSLP